MKPKGRNSVMFIPTVIMAILAFILIFTGFHKGQNINVLKSSLKLTLEILPLLVFAFIVAGMVQVLIPQEVITKWVGRESGMRGILIGTLAGGLFPGGPYVSFPVVAGLLRAGASIGTLVAFITGWSLLSISRLPMDIGILGWKLALIRIACTFFFPPVAGWLAQALFANVKLI